MRYAVILAALFLGSCAELEAERRAEQQRRLEIEDAQCRMQGIQEGTQAWADCHTILEAESERAAADRHRASCNEYQRQQAAQSAIYSATNPYYVAPVMPPCP